jgi:hypothetical protein
MDVTQVRGMLLEEAVLYLLRRAGYRTVESAVGDATLDDTHPAGIAVWGRGAAHQIDAIADYMLGQPFSHPQRLLVEAKCYSNNYKIGIDVVRNAVGVLKDVSEYWNAAGGIPRNHRRYHYQKAIFSVSAFSSEAEKYAFAQDVYLFPLASSACFQPIIDSIFAIDRETIKRDQTIGIVWRLSRTRQWIRDILNSDDPAYAYANSVRLTAPQWFEFISSVVSLGGVLIALVGRAFPLFLVPRSRDVLSTLGEQQYIRVRMNRGKWTLNSERDRVLFSFDLPPVLFTMYSEAGVLTREGAAVMKEELFSDLQSVLIDRGRPRLIKFDLEPGWFERLQQYSRQQAELKAAQEREQFAQ